MKKGSLPPIDLEYAVAAVVIELGAKMAAREPPDVDGVTEFATALFLGALERASRSAKPRKGGARHKR